MELSTGKLGTLLFHAGGNQKRNRTTGMPNAKRFPEREIAYVVLTSIREEAHLRLLVGNPAVVGWGDSNLLLRPAPYTMQIRAVCSPKNC